MEASTHISCGSYPGGRPDALRHGDTHLGNIAVRNGVALFFDWSDACIALPFLDLAPLLKAAGLDNNPDAAALLDLYRVQRMGLLAAAAERAEQHCHESRVDRVAAAQ